MNKWEKDLIIKQIKSRFNISKYEFHSDIKTSVQYQKDENFSIEKEYFSIRVRDVHYRNQQIKILKESDDNVIHQIGYCVLKDFPLEVIKIPK